jgi:hypothetical protein
MNPETHLVDAEQESSNYASTLPCSSCITCPICFDDFCDPLVFGDNEEDCSVVDNNTRKKQRTNSSSFLFTQQSIHLTEGLGSEKQLFWNVSNSCNHNVCHDCLVEYCVYTVNEMHLVPIPCPIHERYAQNKTTGQASTDDSMRSCTATISSLLVRRILRQMDPDDEKNTLKKNVQEYFSSRNEVPDIVQNDTMSISSSEMDDFDTYTLDGVKSDCLTSKEDVKIIVEPRLKQCWKNYETLLRRQRQSKTPSNDSNTPTTTILPCPRCDEDIIWNKPKYPPLETIDSYQQGGTYTPFLECTHCHNRFCPIHGNAHAEDVSCMDYVSRPEYRASIELIESTAKLCSHCNVPIQLVSGTCNHVVCSTCHQDMCYKCGTHINLVGKGLRTCTKCSVTYRDHRYDRTRLTHIFMSFPCLVIVFVLWAIGSIVVALLSCCYCSLCIKQDTWIDKMIYYNTNENNIDEPGMLATVGPNQAISSDVDIELGEKSGSRSNKPSGVKTGFNPRLQSFMKTIQAVTICILLPLGDAFTAFGIRPFWTGRQ